MPVALFENSRCAASRPLDERPSYGSLFGVDLHKNLPLYSTYTMGTEARLISNNGLGAPCGRISKRAQTSIAFEAVNIT